MRLFRPELRRLMSGKVVTIELEIDERSIFMSFENGRMSLSKTSQAPARARLAFRSFSLAHNVLRSAMEGDQFWLTAMRDHRVSVTGDMSVILWLFSLCRHLPLRVN